MLNPVKIKMEKRIPFDSAEEIVTYKKHKWFPVACNENKILFYRYIYFSNWKMTFDELKSYVESIPWITNVYNPDTGEIYYLVKNGIKTWLTNSF